MRANCASQEAACCPAAVVSSQTSHASQWPYIVWQEYVSSKSVLVCPCCRPQWKKEKGYTANYKEAGLLSDPNAGFGRNAKVDQLQVGCFQNAYF